MDALDGSIDDQNTHLILTHNYWGSSCGCGLVPLLIYNYDSFFIYTSQALLKFKSGFDVNDCPSLLVQSV